MGYEISKTDRSFPSRERFFTSTEYLFTSTEYLLRYSVECFWYYDDVFGYLIPVKTFQNRLERDINFASSVTDGRFR
jgi:hypothetical protein